MSAAKLEGIRFSPVGDRQCTIFGVQNEDE